MQPQSEIHLAGAHDFSCLRNHSFDVGWSLKIQDGKILPISVNVHQYVDRQKYKIFPIGIEYQKRSVDVVDVRFDWPVEMLKISAYDIVISNFNSYPINLLSGEVRDIRKYAMPLIKGIGIEVGPGLRPAILPTDEVNVTYIEQVHPRDWGLLYGKKDQDISLPSDYLLERCICDDASLLNSVEDSSLNFIFSSHVYEHLHNPLSVIKCWLRKLKPGGFILLVVPDARYTFDCRQQISTLINFLDEGRLGSHLMPKYKYEQWSRYTAPHQTAEQYILRNYPIHAHYYTQDSFLEMLSFYKARGESEINHFYMQTLKNNKDFV